MSQCPFCERAMFEERIIAETNEFFVIATLGQITDGGYTLIFPKRHTRCLSALSYDEMVKFVHLLLECKNVLISEYCASFPAMFEHGIVGQTVEHAHIHLFPTKVDLTSRVTADFPDANQESFDIIAKGIPYRPGDFPNPASGPLNTPLPYLLWRYPEEYARTAMWWNPQNVPPQYFRTILAEALGRPERANWRTMDPELDKRLWQETVLRLKKYF